jgi:hypothetical protein
MPRVLVLLLMFVPGCGDPYAVDTSHTTRTEPDPADLVGTYVPDEATRELIANAGGYPERTTSIELNADGGIRVTNIPDWWHTHLPQTGFDSGSGTWELDSWESQQTQARHWLLKLHFPSMEEFDSDRVQATARREDHPVVGLSTSLLLVGEEPPYAIEATIRRREVGGAMRFTRISNADGER